MVLLMDGWEGITIPLLLLRGREGLSSAFPVDETPWLDAQPDTVVLAEFSRAINWSWVTPGEWVKFPTNVRLSFWLSWAAAASLVGTTWCLLTRLGWREKLPTNLRFPISFGDTEVIRLDITLPAS